MKYKRLIAVLCVIVVLGGVVLSGALVFRVRVVSVVLADTRLEYISESNRAIVEETAREAAYEISRNRHIIFGLNRRDIIEAVELDPRIRVTNGVVAAFPNRLNIIIRERFAMYTLTYGGVTAILDARLRIISLLPFAGDRHIVNINGLFEFQSNVFRLGSYLFDNIEIESQSYWRARALVNMFDVLYSEGFEETAIGHLVQTVAFNEVLYNSMDLVFRHMDPNMAGVTTTIYIRDFRENFHDKLSFAMYLKQDRFNDRARIIIDSVAMDEVGHLREHRGSLFALWMPRD